MAMSYKPKMMRQEPKAECTPEARAAIEEQIRTVMREMGVKPEFRWSNRPKGARCYQRRVVVHLGPAVVESGDIEDLLHEIAHAVAVHDHTPKSHGESFERALERTRVEWNKLKAAQPTDVGPSQGGDDD